MGGIGTSLQRETVGRDIGQLLKLILAEEGLRLTMLSLTANVLFSSCIFGPVILAIAFREILIS